MKKFVQIVNETAWWIFKAEERPPYPDDVEILDITGQEDVKEGYIYNRETNTFTAPEPQEKQETKVTLEQLQQDNLILMDALAMAYEQNTQDNLTIMSAIAELYEMNAGGVTE